MKKNYTILAAILMALFIQRSLSQTSWHWQNPLPQGNDLFAISFFHADSGIAVGEHGTILRTIDAGQRWEIVSSATTRKLRAVSFIDGIHGSIVGDSGIILHTIDGGKSWTNQMSGVESDLYGVAFRDINNGIVCGRQGTILMTADGGQTWTNRSLDLGNDLTAISLQDSLHATVVGNPAIILHTTDGGSHWQTQRGAGFGYWSVSFTGCDTGMIVGYYDMILRTTNGGATWTQQPVENFLRHFFNVSMCNGNTGTIVGSGGDTYYTILHTDDGGKTWITQYHPGMEAPYAVDVIDQQTVAMAGERGVILRSTNAGHIWKKQSTGKTQLLRGVSCANSKIAVAVGLGTILRTGDGGATWTDQSAHVAGANIDNHLMWKVCCVDTDLAIAIGGQDIYRSSNGGLDWTVQNKVFWETLMGIAFFDRYHGIIVGTSGMILTTNDGGLTWEQQWRGGFETNFYCAAYVDANTVVALGTGQVVAHSSDGGITWSKYQIGALMTEAVLFYDKNVGIAVGAEGAMYRTKDGGLSWNALSSGVSDDLRGIFFSDANNGIVVGSKGSGLNTTNGGIILRTTDGGMTWCSESSGSENCLYSVCMADRKTGWAVGDDGTVLQTLSGGVTQNDDPTSRMARVNDDSRLGQNYPNPFNPSTTIAFSLPERLHVSLKIFDVMGREVATLASEELPAGSYTRIWNAPGVSSGMYFYRLQAGAYAETKRLMLLK